MEDFQFKKKDIPIGYIYIPLRDNKSIINKYSRTINEEECKIDNKRLLINEINPYICASYNTARANNRIFL
ncbi:hypothetical protein F070042J6_12540 [Bacteroides sp. f07]